MNAKGQTNKYVVYFNNAACFEMLHYYYDATNLLEVAGMMPRICDEHVS